MGFLVVVGCGRAVSHRSKLAVPLGFDSFSVTVKCLGNTGGKKDDVSSLIYPFHLGFPLKEFCRLSILFLRLYIITQT